MRIIVIGSGVIGTTSAYYLAKQGHDVTVLERQPGAGLETSFANAGQISPGYCAPWAAPGIPLKAVKWLFSRHSPLTINPTPDWRTLRFIGRMLVNCTPARYAVNKERMLRLAEYSRQTFTELRAATGIRYDDRQRGTLQLFRTAKQMRDATQDMRILEQAGVPFEALDAAGCSRVEPALAQVRHKLAGGLHLPLDETGDCYQFTETLSRLCRQMGVTFRFGVSVNRLLTQDRRVTGVTVDADSLTADAVVVAMGSYSNALVEPLGIRLPVYPVKGYSITLPITDAAGAPVSTVMDETHKVAITRLGDRIRVAGTAELTGFDLSLKARRTATVRHVVQDLFPQSGDLARATPWTGLRPMTPDGTPIIGPTDYRGLYLNTGHGTLGWTLSCGSGRLLADLISGNQPEIGAHGLDLSRYRPDRSTHGRYGSSVGVMTS